ncbi:HAMP domain-containing protein [Pseudothauera nasutitermitis]|uniref:histidine kinase n=2 Tax=Betaproteobacteria TaxID=28216 RepID=A0A3M6QUQ5_9BURK|nr:MULTISPECIES: ATP-binding protein [Betaproteobacteria]RMX06754.1 HAMP domain-containing protein [Corticibacter populi]RZS31661.1 signal transduction histidine kinase [Corticibacter populi]THF64896.1 HAMP domain-containing protein [Pseudothauera nasutitermitis]
MKSRSFNAQLILVIVAVIALCWTVVLGIVLTQLSLNRTSTWDEKLGAMATQLLVTIPADSDFDGGAGPGLKLGAAAGTKHEPLVFQIWIDRSRMVASTPGAPASPLQPDFSDGAASTEVENQKWRVYSATDSTGRVTVQVGNLQSIVDADMRHEAAHALALATVLLVIAGLVMWFVSQAALKPVRALGAAMRHRRRFDFTALPLDRLPRELHPLVDSFNHVLKQLDEAIEGERRFIGDAAHELRTPLSALQAQAEIALRATDPQDKDAALRKLLVVAKRSTRLSEQLLDLASINAGAKAPKHVPADLSKLVQHVAQEFEVYASLNQRSLFLDVHACKISCDIDEIGILLRNLMHNAMRYTSEGGNVLVRCGYLTPQGSEPTQPMVYLEVADDGPGVPAEQREAIFERFHRVAGTPVRGSGIGLSLVAGIAESHNATIHTGTGLEDRGLMVRVIFPGIVEPRSPG